MITKKTPLLIAIFLISLCFLTACGPPKLDYADGGTAIYDKKSGIKYLPCSFSLIAASLNAEPYAQYGPGLKLYSIVGLEPEKWLSEDITEALPYLFRAENETEPTLADFDADVIYLTETEVVTIKIGDLKDREAIDGIKNEILNGEEAALPSPENTEYTYALNFSDPKFPGMYYKVHFIADFDGNYYLYDRGEKRCVKSTSLSLSGE